MHVHSLLNDGDNVLIPILTISLAQSASFITLSVTSGDQEWNLEPGVYDPAVGGKIFTALY